MKIWREKCKNGAKLIFLLFLIFLKTEFSAMFLSWIKHSTYPNITVIYSILIHFRWALAVTVWKRTPSQTLTLSTNTTTTDYGGKTHPDPKHQCKLFHFSIFWMALLNDLCNIKPGNIEKGERMKEYNIILKFEILPLIVPWTYYLCFNQIQSMIELPMRTAVFLVSVTITPMSVSSILHRSNVIHQRWTCTVRRQMWQPRERCFKSF